MHKYKLLFLTLVNSMKAIFFDEYFHTLTIHFMERCLPSCYRTAPCCWALSLFWRRYWAAVLQTYSSQSFSNFTAVLLSKLKIPSLCSVSQMFLILIMFAITFCGFFNYSFFENKRNLSCKHSKHDHNIAKNNSIKLAFLFLIFFFITPDIIFFFGC